MSSGLGTLDLLVLKILSRAPHHGDGIAADMSIEAARQAAAVRFGNAAVARERTHDADTLRWIHDVVRDVRYAFRMVRRSPGFSALATLCLTLGIGANAAVFSWIEGILLRPYPLVVDQDRLFAVTGTHRDAAENRDDVSWPDWLDLQRNCSLVEAFIGEKITRNDPEFTRAGDEAAPPVAIVDQTMAAQFWRGADPVAGRAARIAAGRRATIAPAMFPTSATTRARTIGLSATNAPRLLAPGQIVVSPESQLQYRIERLLGEGGFGQVYLAARIGRSSVVPETVCIKATRRIDGWLREAYFGQLLDGHPRAIRVFDRFPLVRGVETVYCLTLEYARHGDLSAFLARSEKRWTETVTRREIAGVLEVLAKLHRGQTLHRDLTPMNVFVCEKYRLKLGDFGIVRQQSDQRGITAHTMNMLTAPSDILARAVPKWQARDDVYQVGQLLGMLIKGDARARVRPHEVRGLACTDHLKEILYRCIGERRKRYESADEMIAALRTPPPALKSGVVRTLKGVHLAFTGILSVKRRDAIRAARRAGAIIHGAPSARTTVVVRGRPNPLQAAGRDGGLKLMEIKRLREKGHTITLLDEAKFWKLVSRAPFVR